MNERKVIIVLKVYPKDVLNDFTDLIKEISERLPSDKYAIIGWKPVDIAFGYKALELHIVAPEELEGGTEEVENLIRSIDIVDNVDVEFVTLVSY